MKAVINVTVHDETKMMLHEEIATGTLDGDPMRFICSINKSMFHIQFRNKTYEILATDLVKGVLDSAEGQGK